VNQDTEIVKTTLNQRLSFCVGSYPDLIILEDNTYDAILSTRALHFFSPLIFNQAVQDFYRILKPGGRIYVLAITPYVNFYKSFISEYEKRKDAGADHPGYVRFSSSLCRS